jgi:hypothetical protein
MNAINAINANTNNMDNLLTYSNNYIHYLNNSINYLNSSITYLNNLMYLNNYYIRYNHCNHCNCNSYNNNTNDDNNVHNNVHNNENNAYLLNYDLDDFKKLSNINIYALIKSSTIDLYYGNIENPTNDTCAITHEKFSNCDDVTMIKECGHIFNSSAIKKWLIDHQTCPNCRHNILTNSNIISYLNRENDKIYFLYSSEFKFFLALHIETLLTNRQTNNENENNENENNENVNNASTYDIGLFLR